MTTDLEKPQSKSNMLCPSFRKPMRKVCHLCEFWEPLTVEIVRPGQPPERVTDWGCAIKNQTFLLTRIIHNLDGNQKATESFRNSAWDDAQKTLNDVVELAKHQGTFNESVLKRVGDSLDNIRHALQGADVQPRLLNGSRG